MKELNTIKETQYFLETVREKGLTVGFVPTMGALHEGHLTLVRQSVEENDFTVCSIFVNPIQFNNPEDLKKYPRNLEKDMAMLEKEGCGLVFAPTAEEMYPEPVTEVFDFNGLDQVMEGQFRPGHFNGVAVVVKKLFGIIQPNRAYFGEKDFQQLAIIKYLVKKMDLPVEIVPCPIIRETDGLAMSSRNTRLNQKHRELAPKIFNVLSEVKERSAKFGVQELKNWVEHQFRDNPEFKMEYFEIADTETLQPVSSWSDSKHIIACIAIFLGKIRLIDNILIF
jgi:pantoate--beta-alanine ligase